VIFFGAFLWSVFLHCQNLVTLDRRRVGGASGLAKLPALQCPFFGHANYVEQSKQVLKKKSKLQKLWMLAVALTGFDNRG